MKKIKYCILLLCIGFVMCTNSNKHLFDLVKTGNIKELTIEIDNGKSVNSINPSGYSLLNFAIKNKQKTIALYLINKGANIRSINKIKSHKSALLYSIKYNQIDVLELLIKKGVDLKNDDKNSKGILYYANKYGNKKTLNILINHINLYDGVDGPHVFYTNKQIHTISVNKKNILIRKIISPTDTLKVYLPKPLKSFDLVLKTKIQKEKTINTSTDKIFAVADIEGNITAFINLLLSNKVIDENYNWIFGKGQLVLNGDFVDRGNYVTQVLWLIYKLETEAQNAGGKVHMIIGNHEDMLLRADWRYTRMKYKALVLSINLQNKDLYGENTELGRWLRTKNLVSKIGNNIFIHAGLSENLLKKKISLEKINKIAKPYIGVDKNKRIKNEMVSFLYGKFGPLWYRGLVRDYKNISKIDETTLDKILTYYKAKRIIVGHNVVDSISSDLNDKIIRIDVDHHKKAEALLIEGNNFYVLNNKGIRTDL